MKSHLLRPLYVVIGIIAVIIAFRMLYVPKDFGVHERGYMYGWYRKGNEQEWKAVSVKYMTTGYCRECHADKIAMIAKTPHSVIPCENCHGPAMEHPLNPQKLGIDKSREQCLRCHFPLPYPTSGRAGIRGIDPDKHNPDMECVMCHNPHKPGFGG